MPKVRIRVPLNCLIAPETKEALTGIQNQTKESQGEILDRAVKLLAFGEEVSAPIRGKTSKRVREVQQRAASDLTGQVVERDDIDYSDTDSIPYSHVVSQPIAPKSTYSTASMDKWRATRKPILKPKDRTR